MSAPASAPSAGIVPFWSRLPQMMLYPASGAAFVSVLVFGLGWLVVFLPFIGIFLFILLFVAILRYGFECLLATADGYLQPPEIGRNEDRRIGWRYIGMLFVMGLAIAVIQRAGGPGAGTVAKFAMTLCLPCATMTLAMESSVATALNPLKWLTIMMAIGWPYLALVGLCFLITASETYAQVFMAKVMPLPVAIVAIGMITNYAILVTFHLMGYLMYQYHEELGLAPEAASIALAARSTAVDPDQALLDEAAVLVREGKPEEAAERLRGRLKGGASPAVHTQFRKLLRIADNKPALLAHGQEYLATLIDQDNDRAAVELMRDCQSIDPAFAPESALHVAKLAHMAARQGQPRGAVQLLEGFHERFPRSQYVPQCYLLAAELLHEQLSQDEKACVLLRFLQANYPNDALMPEIDARLQSIERMIAATTRPRPAQA